MLSIVMHKSTKYVQEIYMHCFLCRQGHHDNLVYLTLLNCDEMCFQACSNPIMSVFHI